MTRTVSSRIPKDLHDKLRQRCNEDGCNTNDFIRSMLETELAEENTPGPDRNPTPKEKPEKITPQKVNLDDIPVKKPQVIFVDDDPRDYEIVKSEPKKKKPNVIWI